LSLGVLEKLVERGSDEFPEQVEEWRWYLFSLRDVADVDGRLPRSVEALLYDLFAPLL
jgi:hypothetical protein